MAVGANRSVAAGSQYNFWGRLDLQSRFTGKTGSAPSAGAGEGMVRLLGVKTLSAGVVESESVDITGDDGVLAQIAFAPNELPEFTAEYAVDDLDQAAIFQGTSVETVGEIKLGVLQPNNPEFVDGFCIIQGKAKSQDSSNRGASGWSGIIIPLTTAQPLGRDSYTEREPGVFRVQFSPQVASKKPYGVTIAEADLGTDGGVYLPFHTENPITMHRIVGDNSEQNFTLDFEPISAAKTVVWFDNGALQATSSYSVDTATNQIQFNSAPGTDVNIWVLYEFAG